MQSLCYWGLWIKASIYLNNICISIYPPIHPSSTTNPGYSVSRDLTALSLTTSSSSGHSGQSISPHQQVLDLIWGLFPVGNDWNTSQRRHPGGMLVRYPNLLSWLLLMWRSSSFTLRPLWLAELLILSLREIAQAPVGGNSCLLLVSMVSFFWSLNKAHDGCTWTALLSHSWLPLQTNTVSASCITAEAEPVHLLISTWLFSSWDTFQFQTVSQFQKKKNPLLLFDHFLFLYYIRIIPITTTTPTFPMHSY